ncbi:MAG: ABC-three component system middle component 2, partial [Flavobacteriaceae bacterium]
EAFKKNRTYQMTFDRVILFDFYMRFPQTMIREDDDASGFDFEELYSFFHAHPDRENYQKSLNFLLAKELISKEISNSSFIYRITELGIDTVNDIDNPFSNRMKDNAQLVKSNISRMSETKIKEEISSKSLNNIHLI